MTYEKMVKEQDRILFMFTDGKYNLIRKKKIPNDIKAELKFLAKKLNRTWKNFTIQCIDLSKGNGDVIVHTCFVVPKNTIENNQDRIGNKISSIMEEVYHHAIMFDKDGRLPEMPTYNELTREIHGLKAQLAKAKEGVKNND